MAKSAIQSAPGGVASLLIRSNSRGATEDDLSRPVRDPATSSLQVSALQTPPVAFCQFVVRSLSDRPCNDFLGPLLSPDCRLAAKGQRTTVGRQRNLRSSQAGGGSVLGLSRDSRPDAILGEERPRPPALPILRERLPRLEQTVPAHSVTEPPERTRSLDRI